MAIGCKDCMLCVFLCTLRYVCTHRGRHWVSFSYRLPYSRNSLSGSLKLAGASNWRILLYISKLFFIALVFHGTRHTTIPLSSSWQWAVGSETVGTFMHRSLSGRDSFSHDKVFSGGACRLFTKCMLKTAQMLLQVDAAFQVHNWEFQVLPCS